MQPTIQHTLANLEMAPPQSAWEQLSARLDAEYDQPEIQLAQRLSDTAITPPAGAWANIAASLPEEGSVPVLPLTKEPAKIFSIPVRKIAVAAVALMVISIAAWLFFPSDSQGPQELPGKSIQAGTEPETPQVPSSSPNALTTAPAIAQQLPPVVPGPLPVDRDKATRSENAGNNETGTTDDPDIDQPDLPSADPSLVRAQDVVPEANIPNRPYRDASGKVVMDMNLLTTPGNQYVTVTAPNGEQTRISRKFLPVLTFVNTGAYNGQFNSTLKQKIQDLRNQLLQQASFVPSATNFLDIMELKELLQDK